MSRIRLGWIALAVAAGAAALVAIVLALGGSTRSSTAATKKTAALATGSELREGRPAPSISLMDENGKPTSLAAFKGRWLVFAPSMTLCHEVCPMTTGVLMELTDMLRAEGLSSQVAVAEVTVDPWRDTPARLRAYKRMTGANFTMLTGSAPNILHLWKTLGILDERIPLEKPVPIDWYTHKPETLNIAHSDGLFILDPTGDERIVVVGMPELGTTRALGPALRRLLDAEGIHNLDHPEEPFSATQLLSDLRSNGVGESH